MSVERLPALTVDRLAERDGRRCIHCGTTEGLTVQHRANRGHGGSRSAESPANGIILCWQLNVDMERSAAVAKWARGFGWKSSRHVDPATVPVWDGPAGRWWLLEHDGTRTPA